MLICLVFLTIIFFLFSVYSILQANLPLLNIKPVNWLSFKILDTSTAATLFVTLLGALLVRHQFVLGLLPRINYKTEKTIKNDPKDAISKLETWKVEIRNTGLGSAIISKAEYFLEVAPLKPTHNDQSFQAVVTQFEKLGLTRGSDYWLENFSNGFSLSPKDASIVFEIKFEHLKMLRGFSMRLYFQGQLGDKYFREIVLIPRSAA